jgi:hypothetical protein
MSAQDSMGVPTEVVEAQWRPTPKVELAAHGVVTPQTS